MPDLWMDVDAALAEVPINKAQLIDDTDFKTREESVVYNQSGLDLVWNFTTTAGAMTQTAVTPTDTGGAHDFVAQGNGFYTIEIPASSGTINNDTEGFGWFAGFATGILPWIGPTIGFRAAGLNNLLIDTAFSATRGLTGTALPAVVAGTAGTGVNLGKQGYNAMVDTTINVVDSTVQYTLNAGPGDDNALLTAVAVFEDADGDQSFRDITSYSGGTKTIVVDAAPDFTVVSTDPIRIYPSAGAATSGEIADSVWDEARSGHVAAGSFGQGVLAEDLNTAAKASVNTEVDNALDTNIPSATAGSINERVKAIDDKLPAGNLSEFDEATDTVSVSDLTAAALADILTSGDLDGFNIQEAFKLLLASLSKLSGAATTTNTFRSADDGENRITATVDSQGNRTAVTFNAT